MSTPSLHPDERALYESQLRRRAQQLQRLVTRQGGTFTPGILGFFVGQLLRAAVPLCGDALRSDLFEWLARKGREDLGLCPFCGSQKKAAELTCALCAAEMAQLDGELLRDDKASGVAPQ